MTYSVALRTMVLCAAEPKKNLLVIRQNVAWLQQSQLTDGPAANRGRKGAWRFGAARRARRQLEYPVCHAVLNEAERIGVPVDPRTWRLAQEYWQQTQHADGSWGYKPGLPATGSMTCAGICSLVIASGRLSSGSATIRGGSVSCWCE